MNRFKPLSDWRDEFTISKASFFSGKQLGKPLKPDHSKQHRQTEVLVSMMSSSKNTRMGTKKKEILPSSFQVKEDSQSNNRAFP